MTSDRLLEIMHQKESSVPFFRDGYFGYFVVSMPNIIAMKCGIKPVARVNIFSYRSAVQLFLFCRKNNLFYFIPKTKKRLKYAFISAHKKTLRDLEKVPARFFYADSLSTPERKKISWCLGYPKCCVRAHIKDDISMEKYFSSIPKKTSFVFNNFLNPVSNFYLSFHSPCSFSCKETARYNQLIFSAISNENPEFARLLKYYLSKPVLVFGSKTSFNDFWNSRFVIIFDGKISKKGEIIYKNVFKVVPFEDNFLMNDFLQKFKNFYMMLKKGTKIIFDEDFFYVYKKNKLIGTCSRYRQYGSVILNFK